jgi:hypothetical protein
MLQMPETKNDSETTKLCKGIVNSVTLTAGYSIEEAKTLSTSNDEKANSGGSFIENFKTFCGTLARFFKYTFKMIKLTSAIHAFKHSTMKDLRNQINESESNKKFEKNQSEFLGNIAQEAYNAGYAAAMAKLEID